MVPSVLRSSPTRLTRPVRVLVGLVASVGLLAGPAALPAAAVMHGGVDVRTVTWSGEGRTLQDGDRVRAAGRSFNRFVERRLDQLDGDDPACEGTGTIVLKRWRSDGYAWLPAVGTAAPCTSGASGEVFAVAVRERGRWSTPRSLRGEQPLRCRALSARSVPPAIYREDCRVPNGTAVAYRDWFWNKVDDAGVPR